MEGYAILMLVFSGLLFLYAGLLAGTGDIRLIPRRNAANIKNKERYAGQTARMTALAALAPLVSAIVARLTDSGWLSLTALIGGLIFLLWLGVRVIKKEEGEQ